MSSLIMRTEMVLEILVYSPFNHMMQLLAQEYFTEFSHREGFKLYTDRLLNITTPSLLKMSYEVKSRGLVGRGNLHIHLCQSMTQFHFL